MKTVRNTDWQKHITLTELKHLRAQGAGTLETARKTFAWQDEARKGDGAFEPCWTCKSIAKKLRAAGIPV